MVFNTTFNNISVISRSVLLVEETKGPGENHRPVASHWQTLSHNVLHLDLIEIRTYNISGDRHWLHGKTHKGLFHSHTNVTEEAHVWLFYIHTYVTEETHVWLFYIHTNVTEETDVIILYPYKWQKSISSSSHTWINLMNHKI